MKKGWTILLSLTMVLSLAACGGNTEKTPSASGSPPAQSEARSGEAAQTGWFSEARLAEAGLSGLTQPAGTTVRESSDTNVKMSDMTGESYKTWVADAFALITEARGGVYAAETDDSFHITGYAKIPSLAASDVSTEELPSFDLVYQMGDAVYSLYILYYPVEYLGESAGYAEVRIADMTSEWGDLPFSG